MKKFNICANDVMVFAVPILAALLLTFALAFHVENIGEGSLLNNDRFLVMPRNCYLKIP